MSTFDSTKTPLPDIIKQITEGKVQLPDFQRGWVWDDEHVRSLLISVARSFPVGAVMLLETGGDVRFQVRPIENLEFSGPIPEPERLILDGQQRLTSLTQVLALNKPVKTFDEKGRQISRHYYIDINRALEDDGLEDAFVAVEPDRKIKENFGRDVKLDLSTPRRSARNSSSPAIRSSTPMLGKKASRNTPRRNSASTCVSAGRFSTPSGPTSSQSLRSARPPARRRCAWCSRRLTLVVCRSQCLSW